MGIDSNGHALIDAPLPGLDFFRRRHPLSPGFEPEKP